jgi:bifunctional DNA-binding transcriptional regulator/antitoxin component of YhaV-PrlF toxin-antitoxin module
MMAMLRVHYDGWVALPESFRRTLGLERGDDLEAELVEGTIMLRPAKGSARPVKQGVAQEAAEATPAPSALAAAALAPEQLPAEPETPPTSKRRGRPPKTKST